MIEITDNCLLTLSKEMVIITGVSRRGRGQAFAPPPGFLESIKKKDKHITY
jgi:hypothetical protein